ncbi:TolC family protein [Nonlabens antarcticus]|uniref:TolC family protein n=1 Tax=Nonlabens antarcticus TaxID=392714 RepID=UPI0018911868|nr:TolC family protein [Nonlabens antarcticus]
MKNLITCIAVLGCFAFAKAQTQRVWTLQECIQYAIENNISIKQADLNIETVKIDKRGAIGNFLPTLNGSVNNSWNTGLTQNITTGVLQTQVTRNSSYNVTAGVTLFDGLANLYRLQRAKMNILASQYDAEQLEDNILLNVSNSYLNVLFNKENLKQLEIQHQISTEQIERTEQLVEAGSLPRGDLLEIQATFADEEQRIIAAKNSILISRITLAQILNLKEYENFDVVDPDLTDPNGFIIDEGVNAIYQAAQEERYEVKIAEQNTAIAEKDLKIARAAILPTLDAFLNYNTRESDQGRTSSFLDPDQPTRQIGVVEGSGESVVAPNFTGSIGSPRPFFEQLYRNDGISYGLQLRVPIFNGFNVSNNIAKSKINVENSRLLESQAKLDLERNIYQAYNDAVGAKATFESSSKALEARQQAFEYAQARYDVGLLNAFDFNQAQAQLTNAQSTMLRNKYDYIFKIKVLELFKGAQPNELKL